MLDLLKTVYKHRGVIPQNQGGQGFVQSVFCSKFDRFTIGLEEK